MEGGQWGAGRAEDGQEGRRGEGAKQQGEVKEAEVAGERVNSGGVGTSTELAPPTLAPSASRLRLPPVRSLKLRRVDDSMRPMIERSAPPKY